MSVRDWVLRSYPNEGFLNSRALQGVRAVVYSLSLTRAWKVEGGRGEVRGSLANQGA